MGLKRRVATAVKKSNLPAWGAGLALAATYALAIALEERERNKAAPAAKERRPVRGDPARGGEAIGTAKSPAIAPKPAQAESGWPFWKAMGLRLYERTVDDRLLALAAGVVFYSLLALFPAITALVSSYALFADPGTIGEHLNALSSLMPAGAWQHRRGAGHAHRRQHQSGAQLRLRVRSGLCDLERQCRHQGDDRCAQHRL